MGVEAERKAEPRDGDDGDKDPLEAIPDSIGQRKGELQPAQGMEDQLNDDVASVGHHTLDPSPVPVPVPVRADRQRDGALIDPARRGGQDALDPLDAASFTPGCPVPTVARSTAATSGDLVPDGSVAEEEGGGGGRRRRGKRRSDDTKATTKAGQGGPDPGGAASSAPSRPAPAGVLATPIADNPESAGSHMLNAWRPALGEDVWAAETALARADTSPGQSSCSAYPGDP